MFKKVIIALMLVVFSSLFFTCNNKSSVPEISILIRMMPAQEKYFTKKIIREFEKVNNCIVKVITFGDMWDIEATLKLEKGSRNPTISLVKTPFEMTRVLVGKGYMSPLSDIIDTLKLNNDCAEYHPLALGLGYVDGKQYYVPRKLETRLMFYLKSKVSDAVKGWYKYKTDINKLLKKENGYGLPANYILESDPNLWDFYDVFVAGYYWANTEYYGVKMPRIAFRGAKYGGTALGFVDNAYQLGASKKDILKLATTPIIQTYRWQSELIKNNILNPGMWQDPMRGKNLWEGVRDGKIFLTKAQQIDCFFMHGWKENIEMPGYMKNPDDMGLAIMPLGVSFELDKNGEYINTGTRKVTTGGWWWGIPRTAPNPKLAYKLARWITNHKNQAEECSRFGMMPVRKDILNNINGVFNQGWVGEIFSKSTEQIKINELTTIPLTPFYSDIGRNLIDIWYSICVPDGEMNGPITDPVLLEKAISGKYLDIQKRILGKEFYE